MIGTGSRDISRKLCAIASAWPRSSASIPDRRPAYPRRRKSAGQISPQAASRAAPCDSLRAWPGRNCARRAASCRGPSGCPTTITGLPVKRAIAGDHRRVIAEVAVAMNLAEIFEKQPNEIVRVRPLRMARQLRLAARRPDARKNRASVRRLRGECARFRRRRVRRIGAAGSARPRRARARRSRAAAAFLSAPMRFSFGQAPQADRFYRLRVTLRRPQLRSSSRAALLGQFSRAAKPLRGELAHVGLHRHCTTATESRRRFPARAPQVPCPPARRSIASSVASVPSSLTSSNATRQRPGGLRKVRAVDPAPLRHRLQIPARTRNRLGGRSAT